MELSACANFTKITLGQQTKFWTLRQPWNQKSFLTGVRSVSAAPIEGALPILIWRILTPGYVPLDMTCQ